MQRVPLYKGVLIVYAEDDGAALEHEIHQAWAHGAGGAVVASSRPAVLPLLQVRDGSRAEMKGLFWAEAAAAMATH